MSINALSQAVASSTHSFSDAYSAYERQCYLVVRFIENLVDHGWSVACNEFTKPAEFDEISTLKQETSQPSFNSDGEWEKLDFTYRGEKYRLRDPNCCSASEVKSDLSEKRKGVLLERIGKDGSIKTLKEFKEISSLFSFAPRVMEHSAITWDVFYGLSEKIKLYKLGDAYVMNVDNLTFIKKCDGKVRIENSLTGKEINVDKHTSDELVSLINNWESSNRGSIESWQKLVEAGKRADLYGDGYSEGKSGKGDHCIEGNTGLSEVPVENLQSKKVAVHRDIPSNLSFLKEAQRERKAYLVTRVECKLSEEKNREIQQDISKMNRKIEKACNQQIEEQRNSIVVLK